MCGILVEMRVRVDIQVIGWVFWKDEELLRGLVVDVGDG